MTRQEKASNRIRLALDFLDHLVDHPGDVDLIPPGSFIDFIASDGSVPDRPSSIPVESPWLA